MTSNETVSKEVTIKIPIAMVELIISSNELLKKYQEQIMKKLELANQEMMGILNLSPAAGWRLDVGRMVYTRPVTEEESFTK